VESLLYGTAVLSVRQAPRRWSEDKSARAGSRRTILGLCQACASSPSPGACNRIRPTRRS
jgi:hypothetical protein